MVFHPKWEIGFEVVLLPGKSSIPHLIEVGRIPDSRGFFSELFRTSPQDPISEYQVNHSRSTEGVLRGMHYSNRPIWKKIFCIRGSIQGAVINLSRDKGKLGQISYYQLDEKSSSVYFVPENYAHGFQVLSDVADVIYVTSALYSKNDDFAIDALDSDLKIEWNFKEIIRSERDTNAMSWQNYLALPKLPN